ncbi:MAG: TonB-dependent receptor plug domain-containing protein, partial [Kiritimatiellae bacterium]|nr:TonB-dependent receptor plug domain-containing protein [Kiritimatiellia bacterium]
RFTPDGADVTTIGPDQTARLTAQDLPTALRHVPGVSISRYAPIGAYGGAQGGSVYVRGTGESRPGSSLTVFQDGVPAVGSFFSHPLMDLNPVDFADSIEVTKSPRPRTVPNAFTAVGLTTWRQRDEGFSGELDTAYGRFSTLVASARAGVKDGPFDAAGGASYRYSEGKRAHNMAELRNAFARAGAELSESDYLTFIYRRAGSKVQDPGPKGEPTPRRDQFETDMDTYAVRLDSNREWLKGGSLVYVTDGRIRWRKDHISDANPRSPFGWSKTDWQTWGYRALYDVIAGDATFSLAFDEMVERGRTRTVNGQTGARTWSPGAKCQHLASPYAAARYDFAVADGWTLTPSAGTRYYFLSDLHGEWAPSAALSLGTDAFGVFASYARAVHYPGLVFRANTTAWRRIDAETMDTFTLGVRAAPVEWLSLHASAFRNEIDDRFDLDAAGQYHNASDLKATGFELTARATPTDDLALYAGATYTTAETHPVSRLPEATGVVGASWRFLTFLHLDADAEYSSSMHAYTTRSADPEDLSKVPCFWTANVRLACNLAAFSPLDGEIYVAGENVFNRKYEYFPGYEMPGAMVYVGCKLRF